MPDYILKAEGISKAFGGVLALDRAGLAIKKGEIHCLAGGNGSGKSTLIKIISGFYKPDEGTIEIDGTPHSGLTPIESIMNGIQVIYQDMSVFPNLTVAENIALNHELYSRTRFIRWKKVSAIAHEALERIGVRIPPGEIVENLSVASKQLIAISRAILHNARLIIMDEPTTSLTRREIETLFSIIRKLQRDGIAILFVSHKLDEVFEIAENFTVLRNGANVVTDSAANVDSARFIEYMTGRNLAPDLFIPGAAGDAEPLFEVGGLCLENGFADISFAVRPGEILGITGLLGSGRTELAKSLFGLCPASSGVIRIKGREVRIASPRDAVRHKIAYVPEDRLTEGLFLRQPIRENLAIANLDNLLQRDGTLDDARIDERVEYWRHELEIMMNDPGDQISALSGGNQQKAVLGKWLDIEPSVLILNGPTVGVDIGAKHDLHRYLRALAATMRIAVIIISDDIPEVIENCSRILIMKGGRICGEMRNTETDEKSLLEAII
ncbi:MAG: sugar ABC transporter ATP-binding protein [Synergistaceae bacterium]|jgi:simple sugar transport system ATP-binding protein|nr:sugar ABC transporter ATP-binding protein [Synergistaceae bacterium]